MWVCGIFCYFPLVYLVHLLLLRVVAPDHLRHNTDTEWEGGSTVSPRLHSSPVSASDPGLSLVNTLHTDLWLAAQLGLQPPSPHLSSGSGDAPRLPRSSCPGPGLPMQVITSNLAKWHSLTEQIQTEYYLRVGKRRKIQWAIWSGMSVTVVWSATYIPDLSDNWEASKKYLRFVFLFSVQVYHSLEVELWRM